MTANFLTTAFVKQKLLKGGIWTLFGKTLSSLITFINATIIVKALDPEDVGTYFLCYAVVLGLSVFSGFGQGVTAIKFIAASTVKNDLAAARKAALVTIQITTIFLLLCSLLLLSEPIYFIFNDILGFQSILTLMPLVIIWTVLTTLQNLLAEIFRAFHNIHYTVIFGGLISNIITFISFIAIAQLLTEPQLVHYIYSTILAFSINIFAASLVFFFQISKLPKGGSIDLSALFDTSIPLLFTDLMNYIVNNSSIWIVAIYLSQADVALYGLANRIVMLISLPIFIVNSVIAPFISQFNEINQKERLENIIRLLATITSIVSLGFVIAILLFGNKLIVNQFGNFYEDSFSVLAILLFGKLAHTLAGSCGMVLMLTGYQKYIMSITMVFGLIGVFLMIYVAETYGIIGIALTSILVVSLQNLTMVITVMMTKGIKTFSYFDPIFMIRKLKSAL